jgi:hypothetical protein
MYIEREMNPIKKILALSDYITNYFITTKTQISDQPTVYYNHDKHYRLKQVTSLILNILS